jgi:hypothetical protein
MNHANPSTLRPRPLLIAATIAALSVSAFLVISSDQGAVLVAVLIPVSLCVLALIWNGSRGASGVLAACTVALIGFVLIPLSTIGFLFLPSAILMGLALRRSLKRSGRAA